MPSPIFVKIDSVQQRGITVSAGPTKHTPVAVVTTRRDEVKTLDLSVEEAEALGKALLDYAGALRAATPKRKG